MQKVFLGGLVVIGIVIGFIPGASVRAAEGDWVDRCLVLQSELNGRAGLLDSEFTKTGQRIANMIGHLEETISTFGAGYDVTVLEDDIAELEAAFALLEVDYTHASAAIADALAVDCSLVSEWEFALAHQEILELIITVNDDIRMIQELLFKAQVDIIEFRLALA